MKKILVFILFMGLLTGCGSKNSYEGKTVTVCKGQIDEVSDATVTIEAKDEQATKITNQVDYDLTNQVTAENTIDGYFLPMVQSINVDYNSLQGGSVEYKINGNVITMIGILDYTKANFTELQSAGLLTNSNSDTVDFISIKQTVAAQENAGLTCKKQ